MPGGGGSGTGSGASSAGRGTGGVERDRLLALIRARIVAQRRYPDLARRRGISGVVRLAFRIRPDGRVTDLVVRRRVDPLLDAAAEEAVRAAAPLPPMDEALEVDLDFSLRAADPGDRAPAGPPPDDEP